MKKLITSLGIIGALTTGCSKDNTTPVTPVDNNSKYTIINQKSNSKLYETFIMGFNDPGNGGLGLKDTANVNRYLNTGYYNTGLKDYYLGDVGLKQYMDPDAKMKISGGKEISEADLARYFDLINGKIDLRSAKKDVIANDIIKFIENEYIPAKIKNNEQFVGNNYVIEIGVPRKYFAGGPSGLELEFSYDDISGDTKQGVIAIVSVGTEFYKDTENRKLWNLNNIIHIGFTHEPFHFHVYKSLKALGKQPKDLGVSLDDSGNILDKNGNMIIDNYGHVLEYYNLDMPGYINLNIIDKYGNKAGNINSSFGPAGGFANIYPGKGQTILTNKGDINIDPTELITIGEGTPYKISPLDGMDNNPYDPDSQLGQTIKKNISDFITGQHNFTKKIPNTTQGARLASGESTFATNIQSSIIHIDE